MSPAVPRRFAVRALLLVVILAVVVVAVVAVARGVGGDRAVEVARLVELLELEPGNTVAEIGAGSGWLTVEVAQRVGPNGHIFSTELSHRRRAAIEEAVEDASLGNVTVIAAAEDDASLPANCCDGVFMRRVYHHLSDAAAIDRSLYAALKPGGTLAIIDFTPDGWMGRVSGMGIAPERLVDEVTSAGFEHLETADWPGAYHYVAVFERP